MERKENKILPCDKFFWANYGDKNLKPIKILLPDCPDLNIVDGIELPIKEQKFHRQKFPQKLKKLVRDTGGNIDDIWDKLNKNQTGYRDEIRWIKKQWYHRLNGYWFMCHGKPTYICGWHFDYLNYFHLDVGLPDYRDRDRRWFLEKWFAYNDTKDFAKKSKEKDTFGKAIPEPDGSYLMIDTGKRVCVGTVDLKGRRFGDTYKSEEVGLEIITRAEIANSIFGIQSMDGRTGKQDFDKVVHAWKKRPFFFQPKFDNSTNPKEEISFYIPSVKGSGNNVVGLETGLEAVINYAGTADRGFYDSTKMLFYLSDEDGKVILEDVLIRHQVTKQCLTTGQGAIIHGFTIHPTTVGEMAEKAVKRFKELCDQSDYYTRNENGQTLSGMYLFFHPSYDGLEGFVDEYGFSVIDDPTQEQAEFIGSKIGSKQYLQNTLDALLKKGDENALRAYREQKRLYPMCYADCFLTETGDIGMPYEKIDARLSELMFEKTSTKRGNFKRLDGNPEGIVIWEDDNINGRWIISLELPFSQTNRKCFRAGQYEPIDPKFIAGSDTFRLNKTAGSRMSDGGGAVFWLRDKIIDPDSKDINTWTTNRFVCTYQARPSLEEYCEDMLMMCEYWGAWMNPEVNIANIIDHFNRRGRSGYLFYAIDKATGRLRNTPGYSTTGNSQPELFNLVISYLNNHCHREKHAEFLNDCKNIKGLSDMTNYDRWSAAAGCLKGASEIWEAPIFQKQNTVEVGNWFVPRRV